MAEEETWEALAKRLAALVAKIDERDTHMVEMLDHHDAMLEELRTFNREQVAINQRLETTLVAIKDLLARGNGH